MRPRHLMTCYQKIMILLSKKYSKIDDWILQKFYGFSVPIMKEVLTKTTLKYNLRSCRVVLLPNSKTKQRKYGTDTVAYKDAQLWSTLLTRW